MLVLKTEIKIKIKIKIEPNMKSVVIGRANDFSVGRHILMVATEFRNVYPLKTCPFLFEMNISFVIASENVVNIL